ncbi:MAG: NAD(+)/NADH kinase, partial [Roseomonas sp.]|nr:NAD(+)/NADH kinase [Roseomonas sp.]
MNAFAPRRVAILAGQSAEAQKARAALVARYGSATEDDAEVVVALGGDGFMLETLHRFLRRGLPVYGMNRGSVGFLMNDYREDDLPARLG